MKVLLGISAAIGLGALAVWMFVLRPTHRTPEARETAALIRDARDAGQEKRLAAVQALGEMRSEAAVDELVRLLPDTRPEIRMALIAALGRIGSEKAAVPLEALLEEDEWQVRRAAVEAIGDIHAEASVPALGRVLEDAHPAVAMAAAGALSRMGEPALKALTAAVEGPAALQRRAALAARKAQAKPAPEPKPAPIARPKSKPETRRPADVGAQAEAQTPQVDELLSAHNRVNQAVAYALGRMAQPGVPALLRRMLDDASPTVRLAAAEALCAKADPQTAQALAPLLKDPDAEVRLGLVRALPRLGDVAVPLFVELASAEERPARLGAIRFLVASRDPRRLPVLFAAQADADRNISNPAKATIAGLPAAQRLALAAECVRQPKSPARGKALEILAEAKDPASADAMASALTDANPAVRRQAAEILHAIGDRRGADAVAATLKDAEADARFTAARLLAQWGDARGADTLFDVVRGRMTPEKIAAAQAEMKLAAETNAKPRRIDPEALLAAEAVALLGRLGDKRAFDFAALGVRSGLPEYVAACAESLGRLKDPRSYDLLAPLVVRPGVEGRDRIVLALGHLGDPRALPLLGELLNRLDARAAYRRHVPIKGYVDPNPPKVRNTDHFEEGLKNPIADTAMRLGGDEAVEIVIAVMESTPNHLIARLETLCTMIGEMNDPRFVKPLARLLTHDCPEPPKAAMEALGKMGAKAVPALIAELKDPAMARHTAISTALAELGAPAAEPLLAALKDQDAMIRHGAAWALGQMGEQRAVDPLLAMLGDTNMEVRASAAWSLGQLKAPRAVDPILQMVGATRSVVRAAAAEALGQLGDRRAAPALETLTRDQDARVARAARDALKALSADRATNKTPGPAPKQDAAPESREAG